MNSMNFKQGHFKIKVIGLMFFAFTMVTCCQHSGGSDLDKIKALIHDVDDIGDSKSFVITNDIALFNGGNPPKYFKNLGLEINSVLEKDIVLIQFTEEGTIGIKIKMNDFFRGYYINCNQYNFFAGDTVTVRRADRRNIVIE